MNNVLKAKINEYIKIAISSIENKLISSYISDKQYECWLNSFLQTGKTSRILDQTQLERIAKSTTMLRYFYITIENSRKQFPIDDFIIAFRMELYESELDYRIEDIIETAISILKKMESQYIQT